VNVGLAVLAVGVGSLLFRLVPLLSTRRLNDRLTHTAGWAGLSVIAAITVRTVLLQKDPSLPVAPLVAAISVAAGLVLAFRGQSVLIAVGVGCTSYLLISAAVTALL
jgi:branched-subunit amino acid transport protein